MVKTWYARHPSGRLETMQSENAPKFSVLLWRDTPEAAIWAQIMELMEKSHQARKALDTFYDAIQAEVAKPSDE